MRRHILHAAIAFFLFPPVWSATAFAQTPCYFPVSPRTVDVPASGGTYRVYVNPEPYGANCGSWTVGTAYDWATVTNVHNPATGQGYFDVVISPTAEGNERLGTVGVNGSLEVTFTQARLSCIVDAEVKGPPYLIMPPQGVTTRVAVRTLPAGKSCPWRAEAFVPWLTTANQTYVGGAGDGSFEVTATPNGDGGYRFAEVHVVLTENPSWMDQIVVTQAPLHPFVPRTLDLVGYATGEGGEAIVLDATTGAWDIYTTNPIGNFEWSNDSHGYGQGRGDARLPAGATLSAADFNGDGRPDLFAYNATTGEWRMGIHRGFSRVDCTASGCSQQPFDMTSGGWRPGWSVTIADLDGDGSSDAFLYNPTNGAWASALNHPGQGFSYQEGIWAPGWSVYRAKLNADNVDDLFLYNANPTTDPNSGRWFAALGRGDGTFDYREGNNRWAADWTVVPGDFDGDGRTELFLYGRGGTGAWFMVDFPYGDSGEFAAWYYPGMWAAGWSLKVGDFNGDGTDDLFLFNGSGAGPLSGHWFQAFSYGYGSFGYRAHDYVWPSGSTVAVSDFDADGVDDLLVRRPDASAMLVYTRPAAMEYNYGQIPAGRQVVVVPFRLLR